MATTQTEKIRLALLELEKAMRDDSDWCMTFQVIRSDPWIQVTGDALNMWWPASWKEAEQLVNELNGSLPDCSIASYEEHNYLTVTIEFDNVNLIAEVVDMIFTKWLGASSDYDVDVDMLDLSGYRKNPDYWDR